MSAISNVLKQSIDSGTLFKGQNDPLGILSKAEQDQNTANTAAQEDAAKATATLKLNTDTTNAENTARVISAGSADAQAAAAEDALKKKKAASISSQLGINV